MLGQMLSRRRHRRWDLQWQAKVAEVRLQMLAAGQDPDEPGPTGPAGPIGPTGPTGPAGVDGAPGAARLR